MLRVLLLITLALLVFAGPFAALRQPWAVKLWRRLRLLLVVYVFVLVVVTIVGLLFRWDEIYG